MDDQIHTLSQELYQQRSLLVMGRGYNFATCLEGALVSNGKNYSIEDRYCEKSVGNSVVSASCSKTGLSINTLPIHPKSQIELLYIKGLNSPLKEF